MLSDVQKMLIEQRIANEKPSTGLAYAFCLFLGAFGAHRLYLGAKTSGVVMLILGITYVGLIVTLPLAIIDLFRIPGMIRDQQQRLRQQLTSEAINGVGNLKLSASGARKAQKSREQQREAETAAWLAKGAEGRLQEEYDRLQAGEITLAEYREAILGEQQTVRDMREALRFDRVHMDRDEIEAEKERLEEDMEATRWRLSWVNDQIREAEAPSRGKWARFEYADDDGEVTKHSIAMWKREGDVVTGYDRKAKRELAFEESRISDWVCG